MNPDSDLSKKLTDSSSNGFTLLDTDHNTIGFGFGFKETGVDSDSDSRLKGWIRIRNALICTSLV